MSLPPPELVTEGVAHVTVAPPDDTLALFPRVFKAEDNSNCNSSHL